MKCIRGGGKEGGQKIEKKNKMMSAINRKQVPLCRDCHNLVHSGKYDGMSLKHYKVKK
jgi:predicted HNH restriction endonuclease